MTYRVSFTSKSRSEFYHAATWWAENRDADQARQWIEGFEAAIRKLKENPEQHAVIREHDLYDWKHTYRRILFGIGKKPTHRAIYRIQGDRVFIVSVRHVSQDEIVPGDMG